MMALALGLAALCSTAAFAQDVTDPALNGVTRSFIEANGYPAALTLSARGVNHLGQAQIPLSGFDIVNDGTTGELLLPGVRKLPNGSCNGLTDDAYFLIHAAGRPGDADGDGAFNNNIGNCTHLAPGNTTIDDGNGDGDTRLLSDGETIEIRVDRKCAGNGAFDLAFFLSSPTTETTLRVSRDFLTGHLNENLGGDGAAWAAGVFPGAAYLTCPNTNDGYYIVRIPNWSKYFNAAGLNPGDFKWEVHVGSSNDVVQEDVMAGAVQLSQPKLTVTKTPDLTLCPGDEGTYTIHVANDGNATVHGVVLTDVLPAGASIVTSSIPASGSTGTVTFQVGDLAQCGSTDITVTVKASVTCHGHDVNTASAAGSWASFCAFGNIDNQPVISNTATANFDCKSTPDISISADPQGDHCEGDPITLTGKVTNNSADPVDVTLTVTPVPPGGQPAPFTIAGNGSQTFSIGVAVCGTNPSYKIDAVGKGACPPDAQASVTVLVPCHPKPCVDLVTCSLDLLAACPGTPLKLTASAHNCSTSENEDITLTYGNQTHTCVGVAPDGTCSFVFDTVMPACTAGEVVKFHVDASAVNTAFPTCGSATGSHDCTVNCKAPAVDIAKTAETDVNVGDTIHYQIVVTNLSKDVDLQNTVVVDNLCDFVSAPTNFACTGAACPAGAPVVNGTTITWPSFTLPAGQSVTLTFQVVANGAPGGVCNGDVSCVNHFSVTGNCADATASADHSITTVIHCTAPGTCRLTGGGCLNENGGTKGHKQSTFGGNASPEHTGGGPTGNSWEHVYRDGKTILFNWHSPDAHVIACTDVTPGPCSPKGTVTRADFVGTGQYSIGAGGRDQDGNMVAYIIDHTEGACNKNVGDYYSIVVRTGLVIGSGDIVFQTAGTIDCGNLQIHQTPARLFGSGITTEAQAPIVDNSAALLNKVVPNPFSSSMSFAFEVPEGGSAVEVGVYNVAGRLVRSLASGVQTAGRQSVTWDGKDNAGIRMAQGVYFLKAVVGGKQSTFRVIYMSR